MRVRREQAAGKLSRLSPGLTSLSLAIHEELPEGGLSGVRYIRRVVVEHAFALFEMPCTHTHCEGGSYDVTREVLASLRDGATRFEGHSSCLGGCGRRLHFVATAEYSAVKAAALGGS